MTLNNKNSGFTLLELMIVVAIIAILGAIALPNYSSYVTRSNRAEAFDMLTEVMARQQRFKSRNRVFTTSLTDLGYSSPTRTKSDYYNITANICTTTGTLNSIARCVKLFASPVGASRQDGDYTITLSSRGEKTATGADDLPDVDPPNWP